MKKINRLAMAMAAFVLALGFASCKDDDEPFEPYTDITVAVSCSPDLLEFVTPEITFTPAEGESETIELTTADFKQTDNFNSTEFKVDMGENDSTAPVVNNIATVTKRITADHPSGIFTLRYRVNDSNPKDKDKYRMFYGLAVETKSNTNSTTNYTGELERVTPVLQELTDDDLIGYLVNLAFGSIDVDYDITVNK